MLLKKNGAEDGINSNLLFVKTILLCSSCIKERLSEFIRTHLAIQISSNTSY